MLTAVYAQWTLLFLTCCFEACTSPENRFRAKHGYPMDASHELSVMECSASLGSDGRHVLCTPAARARRRLFAFFLSFLAPFLADRERSAPSCADTQRDTPHTTHL